MSSTEGSEIIRSIEQHLELDPHAYPQWGFGPEETKMYAEEAPAILQRESAEQCLGYLSSFVGAHERLVACGETLPLTPKQLQGVCGDIKAELRERHGSRFADFELIHVLGAAKRSIAWFEELRRFEETHDYDRDLRRLHRIHDLMEQAVRPDPRHGPPRSTAR